MEDKELQKIHKIPIIHNETKYWIIRSGVENVFYDDFSKDSCIAMGWDRINDIDRIKQTEDTRALKELVRVKYPELAENRSKASLTRKIGDITMKIYRFINELKIGDIIVTPGSEEVLIGKIVSEPYLVDAYQKNVSGAELMGALNKAREVEWIKRIKRVDLEPNLRLILGVYHGVAHINNEQVITEINRSIYNFYVEDNKGHSIFRITEEKEVDFEKYAYFIKSANELYKILKPNDELRKLTIKTNVQSPGPIELIGEFNLVSTIVLGLRAFLKNDRNALNAMDAESKEKVDQYMSQNSPEYEYEDYDFPSHGNY